MKGVFRKCPHHSNMDDKKLLLVTLLCTVDLSKAFFDSVHHNTLINATTRKSAAAPQFLVQPCLKHRNQITKINNTRSKILLVNSGVPQGSISGLILFTI